MTGYSARPGAACRPMVAVSFKMYLGLQETYAWTRTLVGALRGRHPAPPVDIVIFPTFPALETCRRLSIGSGIEVGAQDVFWEDRGPFTGEVSADVLRELGCTWIETGHAERRRLFHETDETTAAKTRAGYRNGLSAVVCIGETERRDPEHAARECLHQIRSVLAAVSDDARVVFAYEPVWAIGAERPAEPAYVTAVVSAIRKALPEPSGRLRFIYGGSAGPGLFGQIADQLDGLFLGRFAHDPEAFLTVLDEVLEVSAASAAEAGPRGENDASSYST